MIWIQQMRTDAVFSRIALVSTFCAENQLSGKILENMPKILFHPKTPGARIRDGEEPGGGHTTCWRGPGQAAPGGGVVPLGTPSASLFAYKEPSDLKNLGGSTFFQKKFRSAATTEGEIRGTESLCFGTLPGRGSAPEPSPSISTIISIDHPCFPHL